MSADVDLAKSVATGSLMDRVDALLRNDPAAVTNPYPLFRDLQETSPVFLHPDKVVVTRYADARKVLVSRDVIQGLSADGSRYRNAHARRDASGRRQLEHMFEFLEKRLGGANGSRHARLRRLAQKFFTKRQVDSLQDRVQVIVDTILDDLPKNEVFDFVEGLSYHVPLIVICELLDVPVDGRADLRDWSSDLGQFLGADWATTDLLERGHNSLFLLRQYLGDVFEAHRDADTTALLKSLLAAEGESDEQFTQDELVAMIVQFVFAGHETTTNLLSNAMILLLGDHRDDWRRLVADPDLIPQAVEEVLRLESPTQMIDKIAATDLEVAGVQVPAGQSIGVFLGAANRDPDVFTDPNRYVLDRDEPSNMAFGFGAHLCIGASLARMEADVVLRTLVDRFPDMELATSDVVWQENHMLRGPVALPVILEPRGR